VHDGSAPNSGEIGVKVVGMEQVQARWSETATATVEIDGGG